MCAADPGDTPAGEHYVPRGLGHCITFKEVTIYVTVKGGTGAGRRKPLRDKPSSWECRCIVPCREPDHGIYCTEPKPNPGYLAVCPDCRERRPQ